jgi:hypothetical protein
LYNNPKILLESTTLVSKITNLKDLHGNIDEILDNQQEEEKLMKPFSTRIKIVVDWNEKTRKYDMSEADKAVLLDYNIRYEEF